MDDSNTEEGTSRVHIFPYRSDKLDVSLGSGKLEEYCLLLLFIELVIFQDWYERYDKLFSYMYIDVNNNINLFNQVIQSLILSRKLC